MKITMQRAVSRVGAAVLVAGLGLGTLAAASPASADTGTWLAGGTSGATLTVADAVTIGDAIHLTGTGWEAPDGAGSWIAVKLGAAASGGESAILTTEPAAGTFTFPGAIEMASVWTGVVADDDGGFSVDVPFPTASNTSPALATAWAVGTVHHLQLLTGAAKPTGDTPRSVYVTFTVTADPLVVTASAGGRGAPAGTVAISVNAAAGTFAASEALTAKVDGADTTWATGGTAKADGALSSSTLSFAPGTLRAGQHTVELTGPTTGTRTRTVTVLPTASFSALTQGASGTLTLLNLPAGSSVSAAELVGSNAQFTGLPATETGGTATVPYSIPADATLGTYPVKVTLSNPAATFTLSGQKVSPDPSPVGGEDGFTVVSNGDGIFQGLYQSAYSAAQDALFATAAAGTGAAEDGYLYKLDPDTLAVVDSVHPKDVTDLAGVAGTAPYGVGVDDVNGTVWTSNTRTASVSVYDADDLTLLKQFPTSTVSHGRDVVYDPASNRVFITSASEGTNGDGYISVFEGADNDGDGTSYEKITDIQTGPRATFNPVSLALDSGTLVSPSLQSNVVAKIDTTTLAVEFLTVTGVNVGGRGASGIDLDKASNRLYIASQNSDEVVIADATTGATLKEVPTGSQALNVAFDSVHQLAYVTNLGSTNVTVLTADGTKVANLPITRANHVSVDGLGNAYVVDKNAANKVWKISVKDGGTGVPDGGSAAVDVTVTIPGAGGLTLSVSGSSADLGAAELNPTGDAFVASGTLPTVTVTDVRSVDAGWSLVGQGSAFTAGGESFSGAALGWTPKVLQASSQLVTAGAAKASGLDQSSSLATAPAGGGRGTAKATADLSLTAPTTVKPGTYTSVLTLTLS